MAFFAYAYNLAETTRAIEVANVLRRRGVDIHFLTHGGPHEIHILEADFPLKTLRPLITPRKHEHLLNLDQGRSRGEPFTESELAAQVETELAALRQLQPVAVYAGMNLPCAISVRAAALPLIYLLPAQGAPLPTSIIGWRPSPTPKKTGSRAACHSVGRTFSLTG